MEKQKKLRFPKPDPYQVALTTATARLKEATAEHAACIQSLKSLNVEIPRLQAIIAVLGSSEAPKPQKPQPAAVQLEIPEELEQYRMPIDLTGMGSIPAGATEAQQPPEDDHLPDPEGTPVLE